MENFNVIKLLYFVVLSLVFSMSHSAINQLNVYQPQDQEILNDRSVVASEVNNIIDQINEEFSIIHALNSDHQSTRPKMFYGIFSTVLPDTQVFNIHIRLPLQITSKHMFRFDVKGYSYWEGSPIDTTFIGYLYSNSLLHKANITGSHAQNAAMYFSQNKELTLRLRTRSYTTASSIAIDYFDMGTYVSSEFGESKKYKNRDDFVKNAQQDIKIIVSNNSYEDRDESLPVFIVQNH